MPLLFVFTPEQCSVNLHHIVICFSPSRYGGTAINIVVVFYGSRFRTDIDSLSDSRTAINTEVAAIRFGGIKQIIR